MWNSYITYMYHNLFKNQTKILKSSFKTIVHVHDNVDGIT